MELITARLGARELVNRRLEYLCEDMCQPAFGERYRETFTKAFSIHVLEHVSNPRAFVRSLAQCLQLGGSAMVVFPNSKEHGRNFFGQTREIRALFTHCGLSPELFAMLGTHWRKMLAKGYYTIRNCYRMVRKESHFPSADEFHETRYYATLDTTRFSRLALSIAVEMLQPLVSQVALFRLEPLENLTRIDETQVCVLAKKQYSV